MAEIHSMMGEASRQHKLREGRVQKQNTDIELDTFHPNDTDRLLRFHVTKQVVVDRANEHLVDFPWENEVAYSSFHKAMAGKPVWAGIVGALDDLDSETTRDPRKYLTAPDFDDLATWMKQIAGPKWWHGVLQLDCSLNVLNGWSSGRSMKQAQLEVLKQRVAEWWERVEAACAQADLARRFDDAQRASDEVVTGEARVRSWDTWISDQIEDGMTLDEARDWYVDLRSQLEYSRLDMIDLTDPKDPLEIYSGDRFDQWRATFRDEWGQEFDERAALGFPHAIPRQMPEGTDLTPYERERQWSDRRAEEGPKDVNAPIYKMRYRERVEPFWDADARAVSSVSEIIAVERDGQWVEPTEREKRGWESQGLANARYRFENGGESPDNSYTREVAEARRKMNEAQKAYDRAHWDDNKADGLERALRAARHEYETARDDY